MSALGQQDAIMQGVARYLMWRETFLSEWTEEIMKGNIRKAWSMMPPEMKEWLKKNDPEGYKKALELVAGEYG